MPRCRRVHREPLPSGCLAGLSQQANWLFAVHAQGSPGGQKDDGGVGQPGHGDVARSGRNRQGLAAHLDLCGSRHHLGFLLPLLLGEVRLLHCLARPQRHSPGPRRRGRLLDLLLAVPRHRRHHRHEGQRKGSLHRDRGLRARFLDRVLCVLLQGQGRRYGIELHPGCLRLHPGNAQSAIPALHRLVLQNNPHRRLGDRLHLLALLRSRSGRVHDRQRSQAHPPVRTAGVRVHSVLCVRDHLVDRNLQRNVAVCGLLRSAALVLCKSPGPPRRTPQGKRRCALLRNGPRLLGGIVLPLGHLRLWLLPYLVVQALPGLHDVAHEGGSRWQSGCCMLLLLLHSLP
mmetsp:Transcript_449/g.1119  ORF Transcript_449/g.1119 Transcript_449/m.1119 type:complete len:343 (+) Transcript_449:102-1130(+)